MHNDDQTHCQYKCSRSARRAYHILALREYEDEDQALTLYRNYSSNNSNYIEQLLKQPLNTPPLYRSDHEARPIHHLSALTMNCNDASKPIYSVRYNPVHLTGKQTMIYFRTPETVSLLQIGCTNHNYPFYSPAPFITHYIDPSKKNDDCNTVITRIISFPTKDRQPQQFTAQGINRRTERFTVSIPREFHPTLRASSPLP